MALFLENLRCDVAEATCEGMKLLIRGLEVFRSDVGVRGRQNGFQRANAHAKIRNDNITISRLRPIENIFRPGKNSINRAVCMGLGKMDVLEISVNYIVIMQVLHSGQY